MNRKRAVWYAFAFSIPVIFILILLALFSIPLMLIALLLILCLLVMLKSKCPRLFAVFAHEEEPIQYYSQGSGKIVAEVQHTFMTLTSLNVSSANNILVNKPTFVIGSGRDCEFVLPDPQHFISRRHLVIEYDEFQKICYATDISTNGSYINGIRLKRNMRYELHQNDTLQIANESFSVEYAYY